VFITYLLIALHLWDVADRQQWCIWVMLMTAI